MHRILDHCPTLLYNTISCHHYTISNFSHRSMTTLLPLFLWFRLNTQWDILIFCQKKHGKPNGKGRVNELDFRPWRMYLKVEWMKNWTGRMVWNLRIAYRLGVLAYKLLINLRYCYWFHSSLKLRRWVFESTSGEKTTMSLLKMMASWWFQPIWKILVSLGIFPK